MAEYLFLRKLISVRLLFLCILLSFAGAAQTLDTLAGFESKISGEEIVYYSPYQRFAKNALLTRCNNNGAISWKAPAYSGIIN